jgi:hypothetical protein
MMLVVLSSIQEAHLILMQEKDTLRSEQEELNIKYDELERQRSALKKRKCHYRTVLCSIEGQT